LWLNLESNCPSTIDSKIATPIGYILDNQNCKRKLMCYCRVALMIAWNIYCKVVSLFS
jgi:hypothetical protein